MSVSVFEPLVDWKTLYVLKGHFLGQVELCLFEPLVEDTVSWEVSFWGRWNYVYLNLWWKTLCVLKGHFLGQVELCLFEPTMEDGMNLERCILGKFELCLFEPTVEVCIYIYIFKALSLCPTNSLMKALRAESLLVLSSEDPLQNPAGKVLLLFLSLYIYIYIYVCLGWSQVLSTQAVCGTIVLFISVVGLKSQTIIMWPSTTLWVRRHMTYFCATAENQWKVLYVGFDIFIEMGPFCSFTHTTVYLNPFKSTSKYVKRFNCCTPLQNE